MGRVFTPLNPPKAEAVTIINSFVKTPAAENILTVAAPMISTAQNTAIPHKKPDKSPFLLRLFAAQNEQAKQPAARATPDIPLTALSDRSQYTAAAESRAAATVSAPIPESSESPAVISLSRRLADFFDLLIRRPPHLFYQNICRGRINYASNILPEKGASGIVKLFVSLSGFIITSGSTGQLPL